MVTVQNRNKLGAGIFIFFVFLSFKANEKQNETNKKYNKQDNKKIKVQGCVKIH